MGAEEIAQWLNALVDFPENLSLVPNTYMEVSTSQLSETSATENSCLDTRHANGTQIYIQIKPIHKNEIITIKEINSREI